MKKRNVHRKSILKHLFLALPLIIVGWIVTPNYVVLPNLLDYALTYVFCDVDVFNIIAYEAQRRIGERGSLFFTKLGLMSWRHGVASHSFLAVEVLCEKREHKDVSRKLFTWFIRKFKNGMYPADKTYSQFSLRGQAVRYLYAEYPNADITIDQKKELLYIYDNLLITEERELVSGYNIAIPWFQKKDPNL